MKKKDKSYLYLDFQRSNKDHEKGSGHYHKYLQNNNQQNTIKRDIDKSSVFKKNTRRNGTCIYIIK